MQQIWFIRHAESAANAGLATSDAAAIPLTERGHMEARAVARAFTQPPTLVVASPYLRTQQTAQPTVERFPEAERATWNVHEFTYLGSLDSRPTTYAERKDHVRAYWERCDPLHKDSDTSECFGELVERVDETLRVLPSLDAPFVALFTHGLFLRTLLWRWLSGAREADSAAMWQCRRFIDATHTPNGAVLPAFVRDGHLFFGTFSVAHLEGI